MGVRRGDGGKGVKQSTTPREQLVHEILTSRRQWNKFLKLGFNQKNVETIPYSNAAVGISNKIQVPT